MADGFDPCECMNILSHSGRMARLMNLLRSSQSECTDNECYTPGDGLPGVEGSAQQFTFWTVMVGWIVLAIVLYFMRPARRQTEGKSNGNGNGGADRGHDDPAPIY